MFVVLILLSMFPFTISDASSRNDLRVTRDSIVKIISLSRKEGRQYIIVQLKKELKSGSRTDILHILRGKIFNSSYK